MPGLESNAPCLDQKFNPLQIAPLCYLLRVVVIITQMIDNDAGNSSDVQMHQTDVLDWDETDGEGAPPPPQMVLEIVSNDILQLTVTKTALEVFKNLSQVSQHRANMFLQLVVVWRSGSILVFINVVTLHRARLALGWVNVRGLESRFPHLGI